MFLSSQFPVPHNSFCITSPISLGNLKTGRDLARLEQIRTYENPKLCASTCFSVYSCGQELMAGRMMKKNGLCLCTTAVALELCWIFFFLS